ncbi:MAG: hypothetical protein OXC91_13725, partial [Rhodobacteraceae bacterium]|nr:hypothetical protein [Paracoccaceae bacterium]
MTSEFTMAAGAIAYSDPRRVRAQRDQDPLRQQRLTRSGETTDPDHHARPREFRAGVVRAVDIVERDLKLCGSPVHVRREIIRKRHVVERPHRVGSIFVEEVEEIPAGAIFSAHGISRRVQEDVRCNTSIPL